MHWYYVNIIYGFLQFSWDSKTIIHGHPAITSFHVNDSNFQRLPIPSLWYYTMRLLYRQRSQPFDEEDVEEPVAEDVCGDLPPGESNY